MFDGKLFKGKALKFKDWKYPVIIDEQGVCHMDNYNGSWGNISDFHRFQQRYSVAAARNAAGRDGLQHLATTETEGIVTSRFMPANGDGEIVIQFPSDGGAARVDVLNCTGKACELVTSGVTSALGVTLTQEHKQEFFESERAFEKEQE
jgi:hypothetical protein